MHRRSGMAFTTVLAFAAGLAAACGGGDTANASADNAPRESAATQTTAATLPVVTVYKSPT